MFERRPQSVSSLNLFSKTYFRIHRVYLSLGASLYLLSNLTCFSDRIVSVSQLKIVVYAALQLLFAQSDCGCRLGTLGDFVASFHFDGINPNCLLECLDLGELTLRLQKTPNFESGFKVLVDLRLPNRVRAKSTVSLKSDAKRRSVGDLLRDLRSRFSDLHIARAEIYPLVRTCGFGRVDCRVGDWLSNSQNAERAAPNDTLASTMNQFLGDSALEIASIEAVQVYKLKTPVREFEFGENDCESTVDWGSQLDGHRPLNQVISNHFLVKLNCQDLPELPVSSKSTVLLQQALVDPQLKELIGDAGTARSYIQIKALTEMRRDRLKFIFLGKEGLRMTIKFRDISEFKHDRATLLIRLR